MTICKDAITKARRAGKTTDGGATPRFNVEIVHQPRNGVTDPSAALSALV